MDYPWEHICWHKRLPFGNQRIGHTIGADVVACEWARMQKQENQQRSMGLQGSIRQEKIRCQSTEGKYVLSILPLKFNQGFILCLQHVIILLLIIWVRIWFLKVYVTYTKAWSFITSILMCCEVVDVPLHQHGTIYPCPRYWTKVTNLGPLW